MSPNSQPATMKAVCTKPNANAMGATFFHDISLSVTLEQVVTAKQSAQSDRASSID